MARKQIKTTDLIQPQIFQEPIKETEALLKITQELLKTYQDIAKGAGKQLAKQNTESAKGLKTLNVEQERAKAIISEQNKLQKQEVTLKQQLKDLNTRQAKEVQKLRIQKQEAQKVTKQQIREELGLVNAYERASRSLNIQRKRLKDLFIQGKQNTKEFKNLQRSVNNLDKQLKGADASAGQFQRNVGNYPETLKNAAGASGLFSRELSVLQRIQDTLRVIQKGLTAEQVVNKGVTDTQTVATTKLTLAQRLLQRANTGLIRGLKALKVALIGSGIGAIVVALGSLVALATRSQGAIDSLSSSFAGVTAVFDVIVDRLTIVGEGLVELIQGFAEFDSDKIANSLDKIKTAFDGINQEIKEESQLATELKQLFIELTREQKLFEAQQASTISQLRELELIVKDRLQTDQDRLRAVQEIARLEEGLAEKQLALEERALAAALDSISADRDRLELGPAQLRFIEQIKNGQIEAADAVKQAADFTLSSAAGEEALFEIVDKVVSLENSKQELLALQVKQRRQLSSLVQEIARKDATAFLEQAKLRDLDVKDQEKFAEERIRAINERVELEIKSEKAKRDGNIINENEFLAATIILNRKAQAEITKILEDEEAKRLKSRDINRNNEIKKQIEEVKSFDFAAKATEKRVRDSEIARKKELEETEKAEQEKREAIKQTTEAVIDGVNARAKSVEEANKKEVSDAQKRVERQQELAAKGLNNTLEFEEKKLAEAELRERQLQEEKVRREKIITYFRILQDAALDPNATEQAPFKALATILTAEALSKTFTGFAEGGYTGSGEGKADSSGHKVAGVVHANEYVVPKKVLETKYGSMLASQLETMRVGGMPEPYIDLSPAQAVSTGQNAILLNEVRKMREAIKGQKQVEVSWDSFENRLERIQKETFTKTVKHVRKRRRL